MKIYIFVDMEGISGVSGSDYVKSDGRLYATARRYYTWDVNACVKGCLQGGANDVIVRDGHGSGNHLILEDMDPAVEVVHGSTGAVRMAGLDECAGLILLGYHAMAGTRGALLEHTYSSASIQNMWMNGRRVGEVGIDAGIATDRNIPTILVTGDDYVCREAKDWIPGVVTCEVKKGLSCQGARLLSLAEAHRRITEATAEAVRQVGTIKPMPVDRPVTMRVEVIERGGIPNEISRRGVRVLDGRTYEATAETVEAALFAVL
ncbi:MAG: hypothetical protein A3K19_26820 [Lentisphaerae bacterium RIFOXYB12_FULL_65_16]|nr:MAG: hypothetical protein A3K18_03340 [Lentisphaerae bacterium RIFOXYA12_64_32]OGV84332.1 MAG: hypothetical protein A3K19_26820 [Lentisphaerae bacterium RIFOXYB12_FULL_65_16]